MVVLCLLSRAFAAEAADEAAMFRVFLKDGGSLVSFGEIARVGERVVFSMPTSVGTNPTLRLVNIPSSRVDWERTDRYATTARAGRYIETQAEIDYTELSNQITSTLDQVGQTADPARRLVIIQQARKTLADWPRDHYNYREGDIRQLLTMLDQAIADLRVSTDGGRFELNLVAFSSPPPPVEPLLPAPTLQEAIEQTLTAARLAESSSERVSLLTAAVEELRIARADLPVEWVLATTAAARRDIENEVRVDRSYQTLTRQVMRQADLHARNADVRGVERVLARVFQRDYALGAMRPEAVNALVRAVEEKLDAARRLRLARDRWALRAPDFARYRAAISRPLDIFAMLQPSLEDIKALSGSSPIVLDRIERLVAWVVQQASAISPPEEVSGSHAVFVSAAHLAANAARIRREATLAGSIERAWDASSAAAGALMLGAKSRTDIREQLRLPRAR